MFIDLWDFIIIYYIILRWVILGKSRFIEDLYDINLFILMRYKFIYFNKI
jgi:hypothetical protein